jgi:hypothetical protein
MNRTQRNRLSRIRSRALKAAMRPMYIVESGIHLEDLKRLKPGQIVLRDPAPAYCEIAPWRKLQALLLKIRNPLTVDQFA